jgi:hypothetical protein
MYIPFVPSTTPIVAVHNNTPLGVAAAAAAAGLSSAAAGSSRMAYPPNFSDLVDEEESEAVKRFCREPCKLKRGEIAAGIDQRLTVGDLLGLACHRKTEMTADMHLLDSQLSRQCSSDKRGRDNVIKLARQRLSALKVFKKSYKKMARKAGLMAQLRWITQRPWDYPLTPEAKSTNICCPAIQEAIAAEARAERFA